MTKRAAATWAEAARQKRLAEIASKSEAERAVDYAAREPCIHRGDYVHIEPGTKCDPPAFVFVCKQQLNGKPNCVLHLSTCLIVNSTLIRKHSICHDCEFQE